eukprot:scaffold7058_cov74-Skeletonema_dohrnii-CCMP3373.AAC.1
MLRSRLGKSSVDSSELDNCTAAIPLAEEAVGSEHPLGVVDAAKVGGIADFVAPAAVVAVADIVSDTDAVADTVAPSAAAVVDMAASSAAAAADVVASSAAVVDSVTSSAAVVADTVASPAAADMDKVDIHSVLMETEMEEMMAQSKVPEPEVVEGERRIRREDTEVVGASSCSSLASYYKKIVDADVE